MPLTIISYLIVLLKDGCVLLVYVAVTAYTPALVNFDNPCKITLVFLLIFFNVHIYVPSSWVISLVGISPSIPPHFTISRPSVLIVIYSLSLLAASLLKITLKNPDLLSWSEHSSL